ncbi:MAG TPA: YceI family protein [Vicinamibacteria bacterium]
MESRIGRFVPLLLAGAASLAAGGQDTLAVDPAASRVRVRLGRAGLLKVLGHDHEIDAPIAEGRVDLVEGDPARSSVRLRFEARRLAVVPGSEPAGDVPKVEARMRGPEVLDVERYPDVVFASSSVSGTPIDGGGYRLRIRGTLEVKGRSFPVEVPVEVRRLGGDVRAEGEVEWRLRDLGVQPPSVAGVVKVADPFRVTFEISARPVGR